MPWLLGCARSTFLGCLVAYARELRPSRKHAIFMWVWSQILSARPASTPGKPSHLIARGAPELFGLPTHRATVAAVAAVAAVAIVAITR